MTLSTSFKRSGLRWAVWICRYFYVILPSDFSRFVYSLVSLLPSTSTSENCLWFYILFTLFFHWTHQLSTERKWDKYSTSIFGIFVFPVLIIQQLMPVCILGWQQSCVELTQIGLKQNKKWHSCFSLNCNSLGVFVQGACVFYDENCCW